MKRSWIGLILLLVLFGISLAASWGMVQIHQEAAQKLDKAADQALSGEWAAAAYLVAQARHNWDTWAILRAALADHSPMEELDAAFSKLELYGKQKEKLAFAAVCREMACQMEAMGQAHGWNLENIL